MEQLRSKIDLYEEKTRLGKANSSPNEDMIDERARRETTQEGREKWGEKQTKKWTISIKTSE